MTMCSLSVVVFVLSYASIHGYATGPPATMEPNYAGYTTWPPGTTSDPYYPDEGYTTWPPGTTSDPYYTDEGETSLPSDVFSTGIPTDHTDHTASTPDDPDSHVNETDTDECGGGGGEVKVEVLVPEYSIACTNAAEDDINVLMKVTRNIAGLKVRVDYKVRAKFRNNQSPAVADIDDHFFMDDGSMVAHIRIPITDDKMTTSCLFVVAFVLCHASIHGFTTGPPRTTMEPYYTDEGYPAGPPKTTMDPYYQDTGYANGPPGNVVDPIYPDEGDTDSTPDEIFPDVKLNRTHYCGDPVDEEGKLVIPEYSIHVCDNAAESDGKARVMVVRNIQARTVNVHYQVRAESHEMSRAVAEIDDYITIKRRHFNALIEIPLTDDKIKEGFEKHVVRLTRIEPYGTIKGSRATLYVLDDDR